jgi:2-keto-4-pentenoate hydratase
VEPTGRGGRGVTLTASERRTAADALHQAEITRQPIDPLTRRFPAMSSGDAYAIQLLNIDRRVGDGAVVRGAVLGNPATAVAWLANVLCRFGVQLEAGHVILPGSSTRTYDVAAGQTVTARFDTVGSVTTLFEKGHQ